MNGKSGSWLAVVCVAITAVVGTARAIDPREVMGAPAGTDYFQILAVHNQGSDYWVNGNQVSDHAPFRAQGAALRYGHFWGVGKDMSFMVSTLFPFYADITVNGAPVGNRKLSVAGFNDATALFAFWPLADWKKKQWFATAVWVTAPTGDYDHNRPLNVGRNVWTIRPELAWGKSWGPFFLQLVTDIYIDTDNTKYGPAARTLRRDLLFVGEVHGSYNLTPKFWLGLSWYYAEGYQSTVKETAVKNNDGQRDQTIGLSMNYVLTRNLSVLVSSKYKAATNNGFDQTEVFRLKFTYAY